MIAFLRGELIYQGKNFVIVEVGGVGYKVFLSEKAILKMPQIGQEVKLHTFLYAREDALELYGFLSPEELDVFEIAFSIPGVGPKAALGISALGPISRLRESAAKGDVAFFEKVPGIGRKKAQKIALELAGRLEHILSSKKKDNQERSLIDQEALKALVNLGFSKSSCQDVLSAIEKENPGLTSQDKIKMALKQLGKR